MRVYGIHFSALQTIAADLNMVLHDGDTVSYSEPGYTFRLKGKNSRTFYSKTSPAGRRITSVCFHGMRDFIRVCFMRGATKISSIHGKWTSIEKFNQDLPRMAGLNVGTALVPRTMPSLCTHEGSLPALLSRVVKAARKEAIQQYERVAHVL